MARPTQRQEFGLGNTIRQGIQMLSGKNVDNYTLVFIDPTMDQPRNGEQTMWKPFVTIGRGKNCTIRYTDDYPTVSRQHAYIRSEKGRYYLEAEPNATNPTLINNHPLQGSQELHAGDEIRLSYEGPRIRFLHTPANKTTASMKFTSRLKEFGSQALRPYKQAIAILSFFIVVIIGFTLWYYMESSTKIKGNEIMIARQDTLINKTHTMISILEDERKKLQDSLLKSQDENSRIKISSRISEISNRLGGIEVNPNNSSNNSNMIMDQRSLRDLKKDIYFILIQSVQVYHPDHNNSLGPFDLKKELSYAWSGTGFLLNDGSFVTARHVIQPWRFNVKCGEENSGELEGMVKNFLNNAEIKGGSVEVVYRAVSPGGDQFTFTNKDVQFDQSKDALLCDVQASPDYRLKRCNINHLYTDWAKVIMGNRKGSLQINRDISRRLAQGTELIGFGYSYGQLMQSFDFNKIEPIQIKAEVVQDRIVNGMINISANSLDQGSSGGPMMIRTANGGFEVIGIISHGFSKVQQLVPVWEIR